MKLTQKHKEFIIKKIVDLDKSKDSDNNVLYHDHATLIMKLEQNGTLNYSYLWSKHFRENYLIELLDLKTIMKDTLEEAEKLEINRIVGWGY